MLLAIDVGNTNTVLGVFDGEEVIEHWRIATVPDRTADEIAVVLSGLLAQSAVFKDTAPGGPAWPDRGYRALLNGAVRAARDAGDVPALLP